MSIIKFKLTDDHIKMIRGIKWNTINFPHNENTDFNTLSPFSTDNNVVTDLGTILYGNNGDGIQPHSDKIGTYTEEEIEYMKKLYSELPTALEIVCFTGSFEPGEYKTKHYLVEWKKI